MARLSFGGRRGGGGLLGGLLGGAARGGTGAIRIVIALVVAAIAVGGWYFGTENNPITGGSDRVGSITYEQEVALGYQSMPQMIEQMGGRVPDSSPKTREVQEVGNLLLDESGLRQKLREAGIAWEFSFTLLDDDQTVNAFALPGGPVFITEALYDRLENRAQLAGVIGHEIGHVVERHGAERMAQSQMFNQVAGAVAVGTGELSAAQAAAVAGQFIGMKYGREQELESDGYGLQYLVDSGLDPRQMVRVMEILRDASGGGGSGGQPEFMQTHPHPESRIEAINAYVDKLDDAVLRRLGDGGPLPQ